MNYDYDHDGYIDNYIYDAVILENHDDKLVFNTYHRGSTLDSYNDYTKINDNEIVFSQKQSSSDKFVINLMFVKDFIVKTNFMVMDSGEQFYNSSHIKDLRWIIDSHNRKSEFFNIQDKNSKDYFDMIIANNANDDYLRYIYYTFLPVMRLTQIESKLLTDEALCVNLAVTHLIPESGSEIESLPSLMLRAVVLEHSLLCRRRLEQ